MSPASLVVLVCSAQVLVQIGAFVWPALLPGMTDRWQLSNTEAGWITASFYGAYMLAVPFLLALTDRVDAKRVYLFGVACTVAGHLLFGLYAQGYGSALAARALTGVGWAGSYMTAVKLLADHVGSTLLSRAVAGHAAGVGIAGALSYAYADLLSRWAGWEAAFIASAVTASMAWVMVGLWVPAARSSVWKPDGRRLLDFRPVFRNRSAMAYSLAYCVHTLEMSALRGWVVAFLVFVAGASGSAGSALSPVIVATALGLVGTLASVMGNEAAIRLGRTRLITLAMAGSVLFGILAGYVGSLGYGIAVGLLTVYSVAIWLDSSSLTAGATGSATASLRGATLAVHSMLGYAGGFVGPILVGWVLDAHGTVSRSAWGAAFAAVALIGLASLVLFSWMRPDGLPGDRGA